MAHVRNAVRGEQVLQFKTVHPARVVLLDVVVIVVVVDLVQDLDPEGLRVPISAEINAGHSEVVDPPAIGNEQLIGLHQLLMQAFHVVRTVHHRIPQGLLPLRVQQGHQAIVPAQIGI